MNNLTKLIEERQEAFDELINDLTDSTDLHRGKCGGHAHDAKLCRVIKIKRAHTESTRLILEAVKAQMEGAKMKEPADIYDGEDLFPRKHNEALATQITFIEEALSTIAIEK